MGTEYAPQAIRDAFDLMDKLAPDLGLELSGIVGDQAHRYGYHRARAVLPSFDYSVRLPADQLGDSWAASALDIKPKDTAGMVTITSRLIAAVNRRDPRLYALREFFGTVNGSSVTGRDVPTGRVITADSSHLWHVHLSGLREFADDAKAWAAIAEIVAGKPIKYGPKDARYTDTMTKAELEKIIRGEIREALLAVEFGGEHKFWTEKNAAALVAADDHGDRQRINALERQVADLADKVAGK